MGELLKHFTLTHLLDVLTNNVQWCIYIYRLIENYAQKYFNKIRKKNLNYFF